VEQVTDLPVEVQPGVDGAQQLSLGLLGRDANMRGDFLRNCFGQ
jgi:hypothetical protein